LISTSSCIYFILSLGLLKLANKSTGYPTAKYSPWRSSPTLQAYRDPKHQRWDRSSGFRFLAPHLGTSKIWWAVVWRGRLVMQQSIARRYRRLRSRHSTRPVLAMGFVFHTELVYAHWTPAGRCNVHHFQLINYYCRRSKSVRPAMYSCGGGVRCADDVLGRSKCYLTRASAQRYNDRPLA